jgi:diguanylate cyclase (GGDEF)-like protein
MKIFRNLRAGIASFAVLAIIWYIDRITLPGLSLLVLYLAPIFIASWFNRIPFIVVVALITSVVWSFDEYVIMHRYGHPIAPYLNTIVTFILFIIVVFLIRRVKKTIILEREYANTDYLTGAANGRFFRQLAEMEINKARRFKRPFGIIYFDLDNFKYINDNFGHSSGDQLLKNVANALKPAIRSVDIFARLGGDEFSVLMPDTDYKGSELVAKRIQEAIFKIAQDKNWPVTASIGIVTCVEPPLSSDEMIKWADALMYKAKNSGKNKIVHEECKH